MFSIFPKFSSFLANVPKTKSFTEIDSKSFDESSFFSIVDGFKQFLLKTGDIDNPDVISANDYDFTLDYYIGLLDYLYLAHCFELERKGLIASGEYSVNELVKYINKSIFYKSENSTISDIDGKMILLPSSLKVIILFRDYIRYVFESVSDEDYEVVLKKNHDVLTEIIRLLTGEFYIRGNDKDITDISVMLHYDAVKYDTFTPISTKYVSSVYEYFTTHEYLISTTKTLYNLLKPIEHPQIISLGNPYKLDTIDKTLCIYTNLHSCYDSINVIPNIKYGSLYDYICDNYWDSSFDKFISDIGCVIDTKISNINDDIVEYNALGLNFSQFYNVGYSDEYNSVIKSIAEGDFLGVIVDENNPIYTQLLSKLRGESNIDEATSSKKGQSLISREVNNILGDLPTDLSENEVNGIIRALEYQNLKIKDIIGYTPMSDDILILIPKWIAETIDYIEQIRKHYDINLYEYGIFEDFYQMYVDDAAKAEAESEAIKEERETANEKESQETDIDDFDFSNLLYLEHELFISIIYHLDYFTDEYMTSLINDSVTLKKYLLSSATSDSYDANGNLSIVSPKRSYLYAKNLQYNVFSGFIDSCYHNNELLAICKSVKDAVSEGYMSTTLSIELYDVNHIKTIKTLLTNLGLYVGYDYTTKYSDTKFNKLDLASKLWLHNYKCVMTISWEDDMLSYERIKVLQKTKDSPFIIDKNKSNEYKDATKI